MKRRERGNIAKPKRPRNLKQVERDSDEEDLFDDAVAKKKAPKEDEEPEQDPFFQETTEEKRVRLANKYINKLKVAYTEDQLDAAPVTENGDVDGEVEGDEEEEEEDEDHYDPVAEHLRQESVCTADQCHITR